MPFFLASIVPAASTNSRPQLRQLRRQGNLGVALKADELMRKPRDVNGWRHIALSGIAAQVSGCMGRYAGEAGCVLQSLIQPAAEKGRHLGARTADSKPGSGRCTICSTSPPRARCSAAKRHSSGKHPGGAKTGKTAVRGQHGNFPDGKWGAPPGGCGRWAPIPFVAGAAARAERKDRYPLFSAYAAVCLSLPAADGS